MNNVVFLFEAFNPNKRSTFFKHKSYTNYLAYSEFAIKNPNTEHGLFGRINDFPDIERERCLMIGDSESDVMFAMNSGIRGVKV